jgi:iron complex outermembrane receptor protein
MSVPIAAALVAAFGSSPPALAQGAATQSKLELEEVTVTARKREESLLEVPISISAVSEEAIAAYNIRDLNDLQRVTPGFQLSEAQGFRRARDTFTLVIRGLNIGNSTTLSSAATIFMDGAPLVGGRPSSFHDVERIEVLKGPQTAYFGRSTFSGAINLVTRDPSNEWGGQVTGELGRFGTSDALFSVEGPILDDKLTFRATARNLVNGAQYTERTFNGPVGERSTQSGSLTLLYKPTDKLRVKVFGEYSEFHDTQTSVFDFPMNEFANCRVGTSTTNNWICGEAPATAVAISRLGNPAVLDPRFLNALVPQSIYRKLELDSGDNLASKNTTAHAIADYSFDNGLTLSAIAAYHSNKVQSLEESTQDNKFGFFPCPLPLPAGCGRPFGQYLFLIDQERRDRSFEMRLTSGQEQRLRWLVGVNYSNAVRQVWNGGEIPTTPVPQTFGLNALENTETTGVFAGLNLDIVGGLSAGLELRYQQDQVFFNPNRRVVGQRTVEETFNSATPRVSLQYKFDNGQMLYASYAEGVRPGGFNGALLARPQEIIDLLAGFNVKLNIEEEELKVFEVGLKGRLLDDRLQTTVALYKGKLINQQVNQSIFVNTPTFTNTIGFTNNAGQTDIQGVEIEASYLVTDRLRLDGGFGFYDTEIIKDSCSQCVRIASSLTSSVGKRLDGTPVASGNLTGSYTVPLASERDWYSRVEYFYTGKQFGDRLNLSYAPATNVVNLRSGLNNGPFDFEAYVTNVFDQDNYQNVLLNTDLPSFGIALKVGLPDRRQWGLRGTYRF